MSYSESPSAAGAHVFDNVFARPAAYVAFKRTGFWPDKTLLMLENRGAKSKRSINRLGLFQTGYDETRYTLAMQTRSTPKNVEIRV